MTKAVRIILYMLFTLKVEGGSLGSTLLKKPRELETRIIGGTNAKANRFPYFTLLRGDPYSSVGKRFSLAVRMSLVCIQQGVPLSSALTKIERCQGWVPSKPFEKVPTRG